MDDINKYKELFFEETDEYLQSLNQLILELEQEPNNKNILDEVFRAAHTLKGMAATMGYESMTKLTHSMESIFEEFRNGSLKIDSQVITLIFDGLDRLSEIVEGLRIGDDKELNVNDLVSKLEGLLENINTNEDKNSAENNTLGDIEDVDWNVIQEAHEKDYNVFRIIVKVEDSSVLKGARAYLVTNKLEQQGDILKSNPNPEKLEEGEFEKIFEVIYITQLDEENVQKIVGDTAEIEWVTVEPIEARKVEDEEKSLEQDNQNNKRLRSKRFNMNQSIRVDLNRLDRFMNLVSELVIYRNRLEDLSNNNKMAEISEPLEHVGRITSELQDLVLDIRMQPISVVLNRFPRMIRDLSKELNKDIQFTIEGEETELDRTIVSELGEPLVHLIRNAADHGIEDVNERLPLGKSKQGLIKLSAHQEGNRVVIIVSDDGKGIDYKEIEENAKENGIDTQGMSERDIIQLIFNQGVSTAEEVTDVSGRGVGMDAVRQKIIGLGGSIEVFSKLGRGTNFIIKLPLTLSIIDTLIVDIGEHSFALPLEIIERVFKVEKDEIFQSHDNEVYIYEGKSIPVIRPNERLNIQSKKDEQHIIVISLGNQYFGLLVDDLVGQQEIVIKKLGGILGQMKEYLGATILGNGDIILILDMGNLCSQDQGDSFGYR